MIKVPIKCGLGNQMFGYAYYRYLLHLGYDARMIWIEYIAVSQHNGIELLKVFPHIQCKEKWQANFFCWFNKFVYGNIFMEKIAWRLIEFYYNINNTYRQERHFSYDIFDFVKEHKNIANGLWQNYRYAEPIKSDIKDAFFISDAITDQSELLSEIKNSHSVSIHIRRGDYLDAKYKDLYVLNTLDYYTNAISFVRKKIGECKFFVFSDDINWCKAQLIGEEFVFVDVNHCARSYLDMYLMSQCKHNIIANSSFSYWGAWLNDNKDKIVCAPYKWTNEDTFSSEFCPPEWNFIEF